MITITTIVTIDTGKTEGARPCVYFFHQVVVDREGDVHAHMMRAHVVVRPQPPAADHQTPFDGAQSICRLTIHKTAGLENPPLKAGASRTRSSHPTRPSRRRPNTSSVPRRSGCRRSSRSA